MTEQEPKQEGPSGWLELMDPRQLFAYFGWVVAIYTVSDAGSSISAGVVSRIDIEIDNAGEWEAAAICFADSIEELILDAESERIYYQIGQVSEANDGKA